MNNITNTTSSECGEVITKYSKIFDSWLDWSILNCNDTKLDRVLYYVYKKVLLNDCKILSVEKITASTQVYLEKGGSKKETKFGKALVTIGDTEHEIEYSYLYVPCIENEECKNKEPEIRVYDVYYYTDEVPFKGGPINYDIYYDVIQYDNNCRTIRNSFIKKGEWDVPPCCHDGSCDDASCSSACCNDHEVTSSIILSYDYESGDEIKTITASTNLKCLMTKDNEGEYCPSCKQITCSTSVFYYTSADEDGILGDTYYEVYDKDLQNFLWTKDNGSFSIPFDGGRIKVKFNFTAVTIHNDCSSSATFGNTEQIITVPPHECCDDEDCKEIDVINGEFYYLDNIKDYSNKVRYSYRQNIKPCEKNSQLKRDTIRKYYDPKPYPYYQTGMTSVDVRYEDYDNTYDENGNIISVQNIGSGMTNVMINFGDYPNTGATRIVSSITEWDISIYQNGENN